MHEWNIAHQQLISRQLTSGTLPHAILISGVEGAGKQRLSDWLIAVVNCQQPNTDPQGITSACGQCKTCLLNHSQTNPDTLSIKDVERTISVEDIRTATRFLETKSQIAFGKSVSIQDAHKMTTSAANALLKTLEEPSEHSLIVLTSPDTDSLLPTILSRCQLISLRPYVGDKLSIQLNDSQDDPYLNINHLSVLSDANIKEEYIQFIQAFEQLVAHQYLSAELTSIITKQELAVDWLERALINLIRKQNEWKVATSYQKMQVNLPLNCILQLYQLVMLAKKKLKSLVQVNPTFVKEQLLADMKLSITKAED